MDIASWYEINVSQNGIHLFATAKRSIANKWDLERVFPIIKQKFPENEGYRVSVSAQVEYGRHYENPQSAEEVW